MDDYRSALKPSTPTTQKRDFEDARKSNLSLEDEEREIRRQRRLRRRSDVQQMLPQKQQEEVKNRFENLNNFQPKSPVAQRHGTPTVQKTIILNDTNGASYRVESRLLNNGIVVDSHTPQLDDRKAMSCRKKRYQFLNFAPRAMSKS